MALADIQRYNTYFLALQLILLILRLLHTSLFWRPNIAYVIPILSPTGHLILKRRPSHTVLPNSLGARNREKDKLESQRNSEDHRLMTRKGEAACLQAEGNIKRIKNPYIFHTLQRLIFDTFHHYKTEVNQFQ